VTTTNLTANISLLAKSFFTTLGVNLDPPKSVFFNDRLGVLFVRATAQDLDIIEKAIQVLNMTPPQLHIKARFIEVEQDDNAALGFDWYLGNVNMGNGVVGTGGNAGSVGVPTSQMTGPGSVYSSGIFPGYQNGGTLVNTINPTVQSLTSGLNNTAPVIASITGILTDPNFQVVIHALEQRTGTETLAEPEVTTISGRQTEMRATQILTIITSFTFQQGTTSGTTTGTTTTP
jgi:general secretion pathway protein D